MKNLLLTITLLFCGMTLLAQKDDALVNVEIIVSDNNVDNKIYIFDFQKDYIYKYDKKGKYLGKAEISFHLKSRYARRDALDNPWDKKLIYDKARKEVYAQFISGGTVTLKKIDLWAYRIRI